MLKSDRLGLVGKADIVEFRSAAILAALHSPAPRSADPADTTYNTGGQARVTDSELGRVSNDGELEGRATVKDQRGHVPEAKREVLVPYPVEYKLGRRRRWNNDDVQLCAQALCLEEMLGLLPGAIPAGAIFHIKSKRRREITFTTELRERTEQAARRLHELVNSGNTPPPVWKPRCRGCSLLELCMPEIMSRVTKLRAYQRDLFTSRPERV